MGKYVDEIANFNVAAEMDFLNQFAKCEDISNIEYKLQKICQMLGLEDFGSRIDTSRNMFRPQALSIMEFVWASKILNEHGCKYEIYDYLGSTSNSLHLGNYKLIFVEDLNDFEFLPYFHYSYNHLDDKFEEITTLLIGKDAVESREALIRLFNEIVTDLVGDLVNRKYHIDLAEFCDSFGSRIDDNSRYMIDIYIVIYRLIDAVVDLKFDDFDTLMSPEETICTEIFDVKKEIYNFVKEIYNYAIKTHTSPADYCDLITTLYDEYLLEGFKHEQELENW